MLPGVKKLDGHAKGKGKTSMRQTSLSLLKHKEKKIIYTDSTVSSSVESSCVTGCEESHVQTGRKALSVVNRKKGNCRNNHESKDSVMACSKERESESLDERLPALRHKKDPCTEDEEVIVVVDSDDDDDDGDKDRNFDTGNPNGNYGAKTEEHARNFYSRSEDHSGNFYGRSEDDGGRSEDDSGKFYSSSEDEVDPLDVLYSGSVCSTSQEDSTEDVVERESAVAGYSIKTTVPETPSPVVVDLTSMEHICDSLQENWAQREIGTVRIRTSAAFEATALQLRELNIWIKQMSEEDKDRCSPVAAAPVGATPATITVHSRSSSSSSSTVSHTSTLSERKRSKIIRRGDIFQGVHSVQDMTELQLRRWLYVKKPLLVDLYRGKEFSWRHENFSAGCKKRGALMHQMDSHHFKKEHVDIIIETLLHIFCGKDMNYFGYVMSVLQAECFIRIIADVHKVTFEEAEKLMMDYSGVVV